MMKVDYAEVLGLNRVAAKQNYAKTLPVKQNVFAATTFGQDKIDIGPLDASPVTYDAATNITAPKVPTVPTVTTLSMASKIASINTDRTGMSSAEVQARLKAISEAAEKDDFTGLTDGEIFGIIYNRYFVNFGNVNFAGETPGAVYYKDLDLVREQYLGDLGNALGSHYAQYGNFDIANPQKWYFEFWMRDIAWETLWGNILTHIATEEGYSKELKDNLHETINNFK